MTATAHGARAPAPETLIAAAARVYEALADAYSINPTTMSEDRAEALWQALQGTLLAIMALPATCASDARQQIEALSIVSERGPLQDAGDQRAQEICAQNAECSIRAFLVRQGGGGGASVHPGGAPFLVPADRVKS